MAARAWVSALFPLLLITLSGLVHGAGDCEAACNELISKGPDLVFVGSDAPIPMWSEFQARVHPQCRVEPQDPQDVAETVKAAVKHSCHFAVLGGGTSPFEGASNAEGGITIDLRRLNDVSLDPRNPSRVTVGGGALWAEVYATLDPLHMSATGTRNSLTGVAGSVLGGGISFFSEHHGWSCDTVTEFQIVLANGTVVRATEHEQSDLFWALRGGGSNFGVVTQMTLEAYHNPPSWYTFQLFNSSDIDLVFDRLEASTRSMGQYVWQLATTLGWHTPTQRFVISERTVASEKPDLPRTVERVIDNGDILQSAILETYVYQRSILQMSQKMDGMNKEGFYNLFGSMTVRNDAETFKQIGQAFQEVTASITDVEELQVYIVFNPLTRNALRQMKKRGGNALGLSDADGPFVIININLHWLQAEDSFRMRIFMRTLLRRFRKVAERFTSFHPYLFLNHAFEEQEVFQGYGASNLERLRSIGERVDPKAVFQRLNRGPFKLGIRSSGRFQGETKSEL